MLTGVIPITEEDRNLVNCPGKAVAHGPAEERRPPSDSSEPDSRQEPLARKGGGRLVRLVGPILRACGRYVVAFTSRSHIFTGRLRLAAGTERNDA